MKQYYSNGGSYEGSCTKGYHSMNWNCPKDVRSCDDCCNCISNALIIEGKYLPKIIEIEGMTYAEISEKEYQKYII